MQDVQVLDGSWCVPSAVCLEWCGAYWKNGRGSCIVRFMQSAKRKRLFWTIFANRLFEEKEWQACFSNGSALGQNLCGRVSS